MGSRDLGLPVSSSPVPFPRQLPVEFLLLLTVPVVDPDKDDRNWKRPLNCLQLVLSPLVVVLTLQSGTCESPGTTSSSRHPGVLGRQQVLHMCSAVSFSGRPETGNLVGCQFCWLQVEMQTGGSWGPGCGTVVSAGLSCVRPLGSIPSSTEEKKMENHGDFTSNFRFWLLYLWVTFWKAKLAGAPR